MARKTDGENRPEACEENQGMTMLAPGSVIGILGGGQLGRLLAIKCAGLGFKAHIYAPEKDSPAFDVAARHTCAAYDDHDALSRFAAAVDIITYEFENVPAACAEFLDKHKPLHPSPQALAIAQDRLQEKRFITSLKLPLADYCAVDTAEDLKTAVKKIGLPCVLKTRQFGYDGKGQSVIKNESEIEAAWKHVAAVPSVLEKFIALEKEISVIAVRSGNGETASYDVAGNVHKDHILHTSTVPAKISHDLESEARAAAEKLIAALDYVGVLAVEFFVTKDGMLLINEMAPRVHNSGHWTLDACPACQFENHIRAIAGWPLGETARFADAVMTNLIGPDVENWQNALDHKANRLWLYGKQEARKGRKMGHITTLKPKA
ncbi:MAG: 5-(carboxyamino)imidazole ribonucleotide synthase [Pseudomonadota bacterium]